MQIALNIYIESVNIHVVFNFWLWKSYVKLIIHNFIFLYFMFPEINSSVLTLLIFVKYVQM